jgi:uncharacterized protein (TIRG00374 family)
LSFWLKAGVSAVLVALIVAQLDGLGAVLQIVAGASPLYLALAAVVLTLDRFLMTYKWLALLKSRGMHLRFLHGVQIYCSAMLWGMFLPATLGADVLRGYMTSRNGISGYEVFASIAIERLVGFVASLLFGLIGIAILTSIGSTDGHLLAYACLGGAALLGALVMVSLSFSDTLFERAVDVLPARIRRSQIIRRLRHFHRVYRGYGANRNVIASFFALTLLEQYLAIMSLWLLARALHIEIGMLFVLGVTPLAMLISRLPVSIDGIGVFEGILIVLMALGGVSPEQVVALSLTGRVLQIVLWLPWWLAYTMQIKSVRPPTRIVRP